MTNPFNSLRIRVRLALVMGLALVLFGLAEVYTIRAGVSALERVHGERVVETAGVILAQMGTIVAGRMDQLARAGQLAPVHQALARASGRRGHDTGQGSAAMGGEALDAAASQALYDAYILTERRLFSRTVFNSIQVTDLEGRLVASTAVSEDSGHEMSRSVGAEPEWWLAARRVGRTVMGVEGQSGGSAESAGLHVATRLEGPDGRMIGVARATLSAAWIAREAATATQLGQPFDILLTTRDGRLIFSRRPFRFLDSIADRPTFRLAETGRGYAVQHQAGRSRLVAHARNPAAPVIGDLGWSLFISVDRGIVLADAATLQRHLTIVFAGMLVVAIVTTVLLVLSLVRPLGGLQRAARAVADGDLSVRVKPVGRDELTELGHAFNTMAARIESNAAELRALAVTDPLTAVLNRRGFVQRAGIEWARCRRHGRPLAVLALDIDHFKAVNDTHGHDAGDAVLRDVAARLMRGLRPSDVVGRLGGEEFAVVLPETTADAAVMLAERLRTEVAETPCGGSARSIPVTVSIGAAQAHDGIEPGPTGLERLLKQADEALYAAKAGGRNRVVAAPEAKSS